MCDPVTATVAVVGAATAIATKPKCLKYLSLKRFSKRNRPSDQPTNEQAHALAPRNRAACLHRKARC